MALSLQETSVFTFLINQLGTSTLDDALLDSYYEGQQRLEHIGLAVPPELRRFETVVNWPRLVVDALEERLDVEGFRQPGADETDDNLWRIWQANNLDEESQLAHLDALIYGRSFVCVGANEADASVPLVTVESPKNMAVKINERTRVVDGALRVYGRPEWDIPLRPETDSSLNPLYATLYTPNATVYLRREGGSWQDYRRDTHNLGVVPVVPLLNRRRSGRWLGVSELKDVIPLTDAAARALTNLQIASETTAIPQKWVLGMSKGDFVDASGTQIPAWQSYYGAIWANSNEKASVGQFTAASLSNFHETVNHYAHMVAALSGLPVRYLGQNTANPPSADAIRADESRLVKRAERKHRTFSGTWENVQRLVLRFLGVAPNADSMSLETVWRDPATPTIAAKTDAVVKLASGDHPIISREGAWDELGWSQARKDRERKNFDREASDPIVAQILRDTKPPTPGAGSAGVGA